MIGSALMKGFDSVDDFARSYRNHKTKQGFKHRERADRGWEKLGCLNRYNKPVVCSTYDGACGAVGNGDHGHSLGNGHVDGLDHLAAIGAHGHGAALLGEKGFAARSGQQVVHGGPVVCPELPIAGPEGFLAMEALRKL